jgi:hypothetical protein
MIRKFVNRSLMAAAAAAIPALSAYAAGPDLIAAASLPATYEDLSNQTAGPLENGVPGNRLGGIGSSIAYAGGDTFLMLPDRGPNALEYASSIDSTVSYIDRFHTFNLRLLPATPSDAGVQDSNTTPTAVPGLMAPFDFGSDTANVNNTRLQGRVANKGAEGLRPGREPQWPDEAHALPVERQ